MKGTFFGSEKTKPCPACGQDRIGLDYDDDYYIVAVAGARDARPPCGWATENQKPSQHEKPCPSCKGRLEKHGAHGLVCRGLSPDDRVPGCPACKASYSYP